MFWATACILLIVLWVRSYWRDDWIGYNYERSYGIGITSNCGRTTFISYDARGYTGIERIPTAGFYLKSFVAGYPPPRPHWDFGIKAAHSPTTYLTVPHWSLALVSAVFVLISAIARFRWRFSIRTLLIATTLVAVVLGAVVYAASH